MEQFQLTEDLINNITGLISSNNTSDLKNLVKDIHYADMADIINSLNELDGIYLIKLFDSEKNSTATSLPLGTCSMDGAS